MPDNKYCYQGRGLFNTFSRECLPDAQILNNYSLAISCFVK